MLGVRASPVDSGSLVRSSIPWLVQGPSAGPCCRAPSPGPAPLCRPARGDGGPRQPPGWRRAAPTASFPTVPCLPRRPHPCCSGEAEAWGGPKAASSWVAAGLSPAQTRLVGSSGRGLGSAPTLSQPPSKWARLSQTRLSTLASGPRTEAARWEGASAEGVCFVPVEVGVGGSRLPHGVSAATRQASVSCEGREPSNRSALCIDLKFHRPFLDKAVGVTRH